MDIQQIRQEFTGPSPQYRGKPFWAWNGELRKEELLRQAGIMKEMRLGGYFMHSRSGLITEYLGDDWFDMINAVADAAEEQGMEAWLYDEDRWPSGSAGGKVTEDPQYRRRALYVYESDPEGYAWKDDTLAVYVAKLDGINLWAYQELTQARPEIKDIEKAIGMLAAEAEKCPGQWKVLRFAIVMDAPNSNYNGNTYIDTMSRKATDRFIELTHEEYKKRCGDRLGRSIKGIFTDEPDRGHCFDNLQELDGVKSCAICWTEDIFEEFERRYGFKVRPLLPELFYRLHGEKVAPVKLHYIDLADALFVERFAKPINEWCQKNHIIFTGHVLHEDSLMNQTVSHGSLMRFYEHMEYPGVDCLGEHNRCYWIVKQLTSVARQLGQKWLLSELYGCTGWQFNFKSHKAVGDWQALFGINLRCQHLSWYTMEGESKRDYPASILHQSPWYKEYAKVEDYFARFGLVMSEGRPECDVLVINPIESVWCQAYMGWSNWIFNNSPDIAPYEERYARLFHMLADHQIDFDYGEEEMMSRLASVDENGVLRVGKAEYHTVIVTNMLTIRPSTVELLKIFMEKGGRVIFAGDLPRYVNAVASQVPAQLAEMDGALRIDFNEEALVHAVRQFSKAYVSVSNSRGETEKAVFAQVRRDFGGDALAVVVLNTDRENARKDLTLHLAVPAGCNVQEWDLETGHRYQATDCEKTGEMHIPFSLEAAGTRCFVLAKEKENLPVRKQGHVVTEQQITGMFDYDLDEPNVCVLDWVKWRWADGDWHEEAEALKADQQVRSALGIEHRGGQMLQPWFSKLNYTQEYGALELSYEFFVETLPAGDVWLAGERPELNCYKVNGVQLAYEDINDIWVDECFKRMRVPVGTLKLGRNEVTVNVMFKRTTNIEALYLVGDFGVDIDRRRRTLTAMPAKLGCDNLAEYHLPFYTGGVTYHLQPKQYQGLAEDMDRVVLSPVDWTGGCVKVQAAGKTTILGWEPYEADVTEAYQSGSPIDVTVVGTRRNVFGPLHQIPVLAESYGPRNFVTSGDGWTDDYSLLDSGLRGISIKGVKNDL
ncbi:MAG: hypothetical protein IJ315_01985 [Firmicutes bacterium]|nr:hypothetical protein [Bacillota bacterium]